MGIDGRYIIGLTGSIGAGKSLLRKMLMHKGALGLDADSLAHDSYAKRAPAYDALVDHFGLSILDAEKSIMRSELAKRVFTSYDALKKLEEIVHPYVFLAARNLINLSPLPIIVIEAIKLLESDLVVLCDAIWVVEAQQDRILARLKNTRGITPDQIEERLAQQSSPEERMRKADVVIDNSGNISRTWDRVNTHWDELKVRDSRFERLESETQSLMAPYKDILVCPSHYQVEKMEGWLDQKPENPASIAFYNLAEKFGEAAGDHTRKVELIFQMLCELFFAHFDTKNEFDGYACWEMQHLAMHIAWLPVFGNTADNKLKPFLEKIEAYARLNLCRKLILPVPDHAVKELESMRYQNLAGGEPGKFDPPSSGYNQYQKIFEPAIDLFKMNNT